MNETTNPNDNIFEALGQEARVARTARMLKEDVKLQPNHREDISERFTRFIQQHGYTQAAVARQLDISTSTMSDVVRLTYKGDKMDVHLARLHNWMELAARRENMLRKKKFVDHTVAREILEVAGLVADTCKMGVVFGPAQIGKTMTLKALEGDQRFGDPVLITIDDSTVRPFALCRRICERFELSIAGTYDRVLQRLIHRLTNTKRMLMFDEVDLAHFQAIELIRQLHDATGCPVLLAGKPKVYEKFGFRHVGDFSEVTDQIASRIIIRRDLMARTRGKNPQPLYSLEDIRKLIHQADLKLHVAPDAVKWLQDRAGTLGAGGIGIALTCLYLAYRVAFVQGVETLRADALDGVAELTMGNEDAARVAEVVAESSGIRRLG